MISLLVRGPGILLCGVERSSTMRSPFYAKLLPMDCPMNLRAHHNIDVTIPCFFGQGGNSKLPFKWFPGQGSTFE
eukprot:4671459-Amphidinium_carterae.1